MLRLEQRWEESLALQEALLSAEAAVLGEEHSDTLMTRLRIAQCRHALGRMPSEETLAVYTAVREAQVRLQGPESKRVRSVDEAIAALRTSDDRPASSDDRPALADADGTTEPVQG